MIRKLRKATLLAAFASLSLAATASAQSASVTMTPNNLDFGQQNVGTTSAPRQVTVSVPCLFVLDLGTYGGRICTAPGQLNGIATTGDFQESNGCVLPINNSSTTGEVITCNVAVTFTPTAAGLSEGALKLGSGFSPDAYSVPLAGTGVIPPVSGGGSGSSGDKGGPNGSQQGGAAGVAGKKCAKKSKKAAKAKKCGKKRARR